MKERAERDDSALALQPLQRACYAAKLVVQAIEQLVFPHAERAGPEEPHRAAHGVEPRPDVVRESPAVGLGG